MHAYMHVQGKETLKEIQLASQPSCLFYYSLGKRGCNQKAILGDLAEAFLVAGEPGSISRYSCTLHSVKTLLSSTLHAASAYSARCN